jgi:16S rRNA (uracil1498-N3)-methyltransferase
MSKIRIFIRPEEISSRITIRDKNIVHKLTRVLRLNQGDEFFVFDGEGKEYLYQIDSKEQKKLILTQKHLERQKSKPSQTIVLGFPLLTEEKIKVILQKATELGVDHFIPFYCERGLRRTVSPKRYEHWEKVVLEATRQSQRLWVPRIELVSSLEKLSGYPADGKLVAAFEGNNFKTLNLGKWNRILIIVGPEGDFTPEEFRLLREGGFWPTKLSPHILRTETAALFAAGYLCYHSQK